jgi:enoyl-[acyl-carrier protein] reductase II
LKNEFYTQLQSAYHDGADKEKLTEILGRGRAKKGMFEGDLIEGELEIGQIAGLIEKIMPAGEIVQEMMTEFHRALNEQKNYL